MTGSPPVTSTMGQRIANLVLEFDNEKGYEFRVQCEVKIVSASEAATLSAHLTSQDFARLQSAKELVLSRVNKLATDGFRKMIADAFDENAAKLRAATPDKK